jgi:hypothetical protein
MIDEFYDRAFREGRAELNNGIATLLTKLVRRFRKSRSQHLGELPCSPDRSPSPPSRCQ